ncbi:MAG: hypothetical protein KDK65_05760, partial [Chlamydiia bacterium]|nr:hypothetical protein [Chlamydiia bacterium]
MTLTKGVSLSTEAPLGVEQRLQDLGKIIRESFNGVEALDRCPLSDEEVAKWSVLDKLDVSQFPNVYEAFKESDYFKGKADCVMQVAANLLAGGLVTGGKYLSDGKEAQLDGGFSLPNFLTWEWLLSEVVDKCTLSDIEKRKVLELRNGIRQLKETAQQDLLMGKATNNEWQLRMTAVNYARKIQDLRPNESQLFYGGWFNAEHGGGHALIYEFRKQENGNYEVYLYTSTNWDVTDKVQTNTETKLKPVVRYADVPESQLFFNEDRTLRPLFIQSLIEINALPRWNRDRYVDQNDLLKVFDLIEPYRKPVELSEFGVIKGQRAGTCVPSSTKAWLRKACGSLHLYKPLMFHLKFRLMVATYQQLKHIL